MEDRPIVEIDGLVKTYKRGENVIRPLTGLSLTVRTGEMFALMGPSGSGKSTLLHVIGGIDRPDSGSCMVVGEDMTALSERELCSFRASNIGFVFQTFNLIPVLTAYENVELPLRLLSIGAKRRRELVLSALDIVGLSDRADHLPAQLSGGQEQRAAIARAFVSDPRLILADEPTGDLDEESGSQIVGILKSLSRNFQKTIIMVTHDSAKAAVADKILYFHGGRLVDGKIQ